MSTLSVETTGKNSTAIGYQALKNQNFTTGSVSNNTAVGSTAGYQITTGVRNVLVGSQAGDALTDADYNVAVGAQAYTSDTLGSRNVAVGYFSLAAQNFTTATNGYNVAVGYDSGGDMTTGTLNTLVGSLAGNKLTDADRNTVFGYAALDADTLGSRSTALGYAALSAQNFTTATNALNTAVGYEAGNAVTTGTGNTCIGANAGDEMTTGITNTFVGYVSAGTGIVTGNNNTGIGVESGKNVSSGSNNTFLGHASGITGSPGGNITTASNTIVLGDENVANAHIQVALTVASDERDKTDFEALSFGLDFVKALEPVTYYWDKRSKYGDKTEEDYDLNDQTPDGTHKEDWMDIGFKAQAVIALEEAAGHKMSDKTNLVSDLSEDGKQYGLKYEKFVPILVKAMQEQDAIIQSLTARIAALES
jgi:hypothetical protein